MKTTTFISNKDQWIHGVLIEKGAPVELTKDQEKELAPPLGSAVKPITSDLKMKQKDGADAKLHGDKRKGSNAVK